MFLEDFTPTLVFDLSLDPYLTRVLILVLINRTLLNLDLTRALTLFTLTPHIHPDTHPLFPHPPPSPFFLYPVLTLTAANVSTRQSTTTTITTNTNNDRSSSSRKSSASSSQFQRWMSDDAAASSFGDCDTITDDEFSGRDVWAEASQGRGNGADGRAEGEGGGGGGGAEETKMEATRSGNEGVLESPRPSSSFSALGVPARLDGAGPVGAQALGLPNWFEDTGDDMLQRVKVGGGGERVRGGAVARV